MKRPLFACCLLPIFILALLIFSGRLPISDYQISGLPYSGSRVYITATVCSRNEDCYYLKKVTIYSGSFKKDNIIFSGTLSQKLILDRASLTGTGTLPIGSRLSLSGTFKAFSSASNPGEFDLADYYHNLNFIGKITGGTVLKCASPAFCPGEMLQRFREYSENRLYSVFPEKEASVLCDLLFGDKTRLDADIKSLYQRNGIAHILAISGLHMSILGTGLYKLLRKAGLSPKISAPAGCMVLVLYGLMTGMSLSALRAIGLYVIKMLGIILGRTDDALTGMGLLTVLVCCLNPRNLAGCSFLLSFGCAFGIICFYPALANIFSTALLGIKNRLRLPEKLYIENALRRRINSAGSTILKSIFNSLLGSLSILLTVLPVQLWFFYEIPVYSIFLNLLILPLMSVLMVSGILSVIFCGAGIIGSGACLILQFYEKLCLLSDDLPFHTWNPGRPAVWMVIIYYLVWLLIVLSGNIRISERFRYKFSLLLTAVPFALVLLFVFPKLKAETALFLDVGQGDCILLYTDAREVFLFDGGSTSKSNVGQYVIKQALKYYGLSRIDALLISHTDTDHISGVLEILENRDKWYFEIGRVCLSGCTLPASFNLSRLYELCSSDSFKKCIPVTTIATGDCIKSGDDTLLCLHPSADFICEDINSASECFLITFKNGETLLMTGDVQEDGEEALTKNLTQLLAGRQFPAAGNYSENNKNLKGITVLKVSHHGSKYSTTDSFLEAASPRLAIISVGKYNTYGHPHGETLSRLSAANVPYLTTMDSGAVTLDFSGSSVRIRTFN